MWYYYTLTIPIFLFIGIKIYYYKIDQLNDLNNKYNDI